MKALSVAAFLLLAACGSNVHDEIVAPDATGQAMQRAKLSPSEQPGFDRFVEIGKGAYGLSTQVPEDVTSAINVGNSLLSSDKTGETTRPSVRAAARASQDAQYQLLANTAKRQCVGIEGTLRTACLADVKATLSEAHVPVEYWPN
jgi:hypothetical protein